MKTIYWPLTDSFITKCEVLFETESSLFVRTESGTETTLSKSDENKEWFHSIESVHEYREGVAARKIEKLKAELAELELQTTEV